MKSIAQQVRELESLPVAALAERYEEVFGKPPRVKNRRWLQREVAWKIQECAYGGLSDTAKAKLEELMDQIEFPLGRPKEPAQRPRRSPPKATPAVGTTLRRVYRGVEHLVEVRDDGFEWQGTLYRSLSAVAGAISNSHWNGRLFFGLTSRKARA